MLRGLLLAIALVGSLLHPAAAAAAPSAPLRFLNIPLPGYEQAACRAGASEACAATLLRALAVAQKDAGLPALVLPADFAQTPPANALLVLINAERRSWGLPAATFSLRLDAVAAAGAAAVADPTLPPRCCWGAVEASESHPWVFSVSALYLADYCWVFWDGRNSPNASGPFAHSEILLGNFGTAPKIGAAAIEARGEYVLTAVIEQ